MFREFKRSYLIINIILTVTLLVLMLNLFVFKFTSFLFLIPSILIPTIIIIKIFGYEPKKRRFMYELILYIFIYCLLFLVITYLIGLFTGFYRNIYILNLKNILTNIIPYILLIINGEILRYEIMRKGERSICSYILITVILILVDITMFLTTYDLSTGDGEIKFICTILLPSISKNILLLYLSRNGGPVPGIVYRLLLDLKLFVVPIFPNFGSFLECIVNVCFPPLVGLVTYFSLNKFNTSKEVKIRERKKNRVVFLIYAIFFIIVFAGNILVSCQFKYGMLAIGSNSMATYINKGDSVIYERKSDDLKINIGDILVFRKESKVIVHRIIDIVNINDNEVYYYTKGDNNNDPDGYPISNEMVIGIFKSRIRYIGLPSVALKELFDK